MPPREKLQQFYLPQTKLVGPTALADLHTAPCGKTYLRGEGQVEGEWVRVSEEDAPRARATCAETSRGCRFLYLNLDTE